MIIHYQTTRFINEVLEQGEYGFLFSHLVIIDVGCNIGAFALYMMPHASKIHSIDIAQENIDNLNLTIKENNIVNIQPYSCAISGKTETRRVRRSGTAGGGGWRLEDIGDLDVSSYSLNDFMNKYAIPFADIVKIDVEGGEVEILEAPDFPKDRISTIIGECHGDNNERVKSILLAHGYRWTEGLGSHFMGRK